LQQSAAPCFAIKRPIGRGKIDSVVEGSGKFNELVDRVPAGDSAALRLTIAGQPPKVARRRLMAASHQKRHEFLLCTNVDARVEKASSL
jgi:hypothetical protein